jgi:hypothetical protein
MAIYPNPFVSGELKLELFNIESNTSMLLEVYSISGSKISNLSMLVPSDNIIKLNDITGNLGKGVYLIRVITSTNTLNSKLVVN